MSRLKREFLTESIESASYNRCESDASEPILREYLGSGPMNEFKNYLRTCPPSDRLWIERGLAVGRVISMLSYLRLKARFRGAVQAGEKTRPHRKDDTLRDHAALHG